MNEIKEVWLRFLKSFLQFLCSILKWAITPAGISAIVLIISLFFLILTFQYAYRPYVGISQVNSYYDKDKKDLTAFIKIKNTGNIPANNVQTNMKMIINAAVLEKMEGTSRFVLFPEQESTGNPTFHNVEDSNLKNDKIDISLEIKYDLPIRFIFKIHTRKFKPVELLRYEYRTGKFVLISGESL